MTDIRAGGYVWSSVTLTALGHTSSVFSPAFLWLAVDEIVCSHLVFLLRPTLLFTPPLLATSLTPPPATSSKATPVSKHTQLVHKLQLMLMETPDQPSQYLMDICQ